jgi:hypothetical protein
MGNYKFQKFLNIYLIYTLLMIKDDYMRYDFLIYGILVLLIGLILLLLVFLGRFGYSLYPLALSAIVTIIGGVILGRGVKNLGYSNILTGLIIIVVGLIFFIGGINILIYTYHTVTVSALYQQTYYYHTVLNSFTNGIIFTIFSLLMMFVGAALAFLDILPTIAKKGAKISDLFKF